MFLSWEVPEKKVRSYLLNVRSRDGRSKALFFLARGFTDAEWRTLAQALTQHPIDHPPSIADETEYGRKLVARCQIRTPDGSNPCIRTVWMDEVGREPRLITAYPAES